MQSYAADTPLGVLMLDTQFPRPLGDIGHPGSFDFPVLYETVPLADPDLVVRGDPSHLLPGFIAAGRRLTTQGARGISTSCGFLTLFQDELATALDVPVLTSALCAAKRLSSDLPDGKRLAILTISASSLTDAQLRAATVPPNCVIGTTEDGHTFTDAILGNRPNFDQSAAQQDMVAAARKLMRLNSDIGAILLECTNMGPYADAVADATGVPVHSIITELTRFQRALRPTSGASSARSAI